LPLLKAPSLLQALDQLTTDYSWCKMIYDLLYFSFKNKCVVLNSNFYLTKTRTLIFCYVALIFYDHLQAFKHGNTKLLK